MIQGKSGKLTPQDERSVMPVWQDDVAYIDSIAKGEKMTAEEEEDVIKIEKAGTSLRWQDSTRFHVRLRLLGCVWLCFPAPNLVSGRDWSNAGATRSAATSLASEPNSSKSMLLA